MLDGLGVYHFRGRKPCSAQEVGVVQAWTRRKAEVLTEAYENGEVAPEKCEDPENFADPQTKYLTYKPWARHLHYTHNFEGDPPPRAEKKKKIAAVLTPKMPWGLTLD